MNRRMWRSKFIDAPCGKNEMNSTATGLNREKEMQDAGYTMWT